jgi:orotidine-5'-phosphate decarboxylase
MPTVDAVKERLCVALDVPSKAEAFEIAKEIGDLVGTFKIGMELFSAEGPEIVRELHRLGCATFLDLKYHDIPNTVAGAARVATRMGVTLFDVHTMGGRAMMEAAANAVRDESLKLGVKPPKVLGVTVLTSLAAQSLSDELNISLPLAEQVTHLALLAQRSGLDGVVASPQEIGSIRAACGKSFLILTPGIRPTGVSADDQERTTTPRQAVEMGANYIVVGRPITRAANRVEATTKILKEMVTG